jgi:hypothetical protein
MGLLPILEKKFFFAKKKTKDKPICETKRSRRGLLRWLSPEGA